MHKFAILLLVVVSVAFAQPKDRATIISETAASMPSGVQNNITAQKIRNALTDIVNAAPNFKADGVYSVKAYGATGNGTTDDTAAIAACFAAAPAGATVYFPAGVYVLRNYVTIGVDNLTVRGDGAKIISDGEGQDRKFNVVGRSRVRFVGLRIDGLGLTSENMTAPPGFPPPEHPDWVFPGFDTYTPRNRPGTIHFKDSTECEVTDCRFDGVNWPVTILGDCSLIRIDGNTFAQYYAAVYSYFSDDASSHNEDIGGHPQPRRISVTNNDFLPGKYRSFDFYNAYGIYGDRDYTFNDKGCSGAIKFRGSGDADSKPWMVAAQHVITGNTIRDPGMMGIELQGCANDSLVANNNISSVPFGVSLSTISRMVVTGNVIKDTVYASVECEGWLDGVSPNNDGILISNNMMEGRDDYGRPVNWVDNFGVVVDDNCHNVVISDNVIKYHRTGVAVKGGSGDVKITNCRIVTNEQSGTGGVGPYPDGPWTDNFVQGIIVLNGSRVEIADCSFAPSGTAWCRMINLVNASDVSVRNCTIQSNNTGVYVHGSSKILVQGTTFKAGANPGGISPAFIFIDSSPADCADVSIRANRFEGTLANGISAYVPSHTVSNLLVEDNDTRFATVANARFLDIGVSGTGRATSVITRRNVGGTAESNTIDLPVKTVIGTDGAYADRAAFSTYVCWYATDFTLQPDAWAGQRKEITLFTPHSVTIRPATYPNITDLTASGDTLTKAAHGLTVGAALRFVSGTGFSGLSAGVAYYVTAVPSSSTFKLAATPAGTAIAVGTSSGGVFTPSDRINNLAANWLLGSQGEQASLVSDGVGNWTVVSASANASAPLGTAVVRGSLKVDGASNGVELKQIASTVQTNDFGTIAAGSEATFGFAINCTTGTTNRPVVLLGWISYFDPAIVPRAYIDSTNHCTVRLYNPTGAPISVGSLTFRALVIEPMAP